MREEFEVILAHSFLRDEQSLLMIVSSFQEKHFDNIHIGKIYRIVKDHYESYHNLPDFEIVKAQLKDEEKETFDDINSIHFDISKSWDWLQEETDGYIKQKSLEHAIIESVDLVKDGKYGDIEDKIREALIAGTKVDLGLPYFDGMKERILRLKNFEDKRLKTGYDGFDKPTNGGLVIPSLSVFMGRVNFGKSLLLSNIALNLVGQGKTVALITLEITQDLLAQRVDGHLTGMNVNRIYLERDKREKLYKISNAKRQGYETWEEYDAHLKAEDARIIGNEYGELWIKEFPPATIDVSHIRAYLRELDIRNIKYDVILVDYINLMKSFKGTKDDLYSSGKRIAEELRALSYYTVCPVITVTQFNREGTWASFDELDMHHISESIGVAATADFIAIMGRNEEEIVFKSEMSFKIIKNRMGPIPGPFKLYLNPYSLRIYEDVQKFTESFEVLEHGEKPELFEHKT